MLEAFFTRYATGYAYAKSDGAWCYEDGCVYRGLLELFRATGDASWRDLLVRLAAQQVAGDGGLRGYDLESYNVDNILAGRVLFDLARDGDERFARAADLLASQLASHPRISTGNYWHKKIYPRQVWLDGLYMALPFQIEYGLSRGQGALVDDAAAQLLGAMDLMQHRKTGLYSHGYDEGRVQPWANPETGLSRGLWARAVGWLAMAMCDCVELLPAAHPARAAIVDRALMLAAAIDRFRTPGGHWLQVLDQPGLPGNYEETSAGAMFAYFLLRMGRLVDRTDLARQGSAAVDAIARDYLRSDNDGQLHMTGICEVAGLGPFRGRFRDGTPEYYVTEATVADDPKGVGALMMARAEQLMLVNAT